MRQDVRPPSQVQCGLRAPSTCGICLPFQGPGKRHRGASGALVCALMDVGPGFLLRSLMKCPKRGALWRTMRLRYGPVFSFSTASNQVDFLA